VTSKPEFGECLFTATTGEFGAAICTCDTEECNNQASLSFIVDPEVGPMRLLQFIDGSLFDVKDEVNSIVEGLLQADGKVDPTNVAAVREVDVDAIMLLDGMSERTSKAELWGIILDFQTMNSGSNLVEDVDPFTTITVDRAGSGSGSDEDTTFTTVVTTTTIAAVATTTKVVATEVGTTQPDSVTDAPGTSAPASLTFTVPLDIDLSTLAPDALTVVKNGLVAAAAMAGGFDPALVDTIELVQNGIVVGRRRRQANSRRQRANSPITARVIFIDDAVIDLEAATDTMNKAIEAGAVSVSFVIGGETFAATVTEVATAIAAIENGSGSGSKIVGAVSSAGVQTTDPMLVMLIGCGLTLHLLAAIVD
jgi:hypothetical protein